MTNTATLSEAQLRQFTGSENWYRHGINHSVLFTDGAKYVADHGAPIGCWTLLLSRSSMTNVSLPKSSRSGSSPLAKIAVQQSSARTVTT
jgi:hypothetical protein